MDVERAIQYLQTYASPVELAALGFILHGTPAPEDAIRAATAGQRPDGGWAPFWAPDYSSLDATCYRLARLALLGLDASEPAIQHAAAFFRSRQHPVGYWDEDASVGEYAPPWAQPGSLSARLYLTANVAASCPSQLEKGNDESAQSAARYLLAHLNPEGAFPSFLQTHWLAAALFLQLRRTSPGERLLAYLAPRLVDLPAASLAWMLACLLPAGARSNHPLVTAAASRLESLQTPAGNWPDDEGAGNETHITLTSLYALNLLGRFP